MVAAFDILFYQISYTNQRLDSVASQAKSYKLKHGNSTLIHTEKFKIDL